MKSDKDAREINRLLLAEEYRAERTISIVRVIFYGCALLEIAAVSFLEAGRTYRPLVLPALIIFLFTIGMMLDTLLWGSRRFYKYYNRYVKYLIITVDIGIVTALLYYTRKYGAIDLTGDWIPAFFFLCMGAILMMASIFRHSAPSCMYTGAAVIASFLIISYISGSIRSIIEILVRDGHYRLANAMFFWTAGALIALSSLISTRQRKILIKSKRQERLERFLPDVVAQEILAGERDISVGGSRQQVTILFSDIRNFTAMSEKLEPEEVIDFLNTYFNDMIEIVFRYGGALDKIMGDGLMAVYGYPVVSDRDAEEAVRSAVDMQRKLADLNEIRRLKNLEPIQIGVGIHTGEVIMGNVGSEKRMDFTAIGDTVNTASRLENLTKEFRTPIIISEQTRGRLNGDFRIEKLDVIKIRGREASVGIYGVEV